MFRFCTCRPAQDWDKFCSPEVTGKKDWLQVCEFSSEHLCWKHIGVVAFVHKYFLIRVSVADIYTMIELESAFFLNVHEMQ